MRRKDVTRNMAQQKSIKTTGGVRRQVKAIQKTPGGEVTRGFDINDTRR